MVPVTTNQIVLGHLDFHGTSQSKMDDDWSPMTS